MKRHPSLKMGYDIVTKEPECKVYLKKELLNKNIMCSEVLV